MKLHPLLTFDGSTPAPGVTHLRVSRPVTPPYRPDPATRDALALAAAINQFAVGVNPRYVPRDTSGDGRQDTHCDAFAADVCAALGVPLPQWVDGDGNPQPPGAGHEVSANGMAVWLDVFGSRFGWREVRREESQALANEGHPVLVTWKNPPGRSGHIAVVRPAESHEDGPVIAQAGVVRFNRGTVGQGFGEGRTLRYWTHQGPSTR